MATLFVSTMPEPAAVDFSKVRNSPLMLHMAKKVDAEKFEHFLNAVCENIVRLKMAPMVTPWKWSGSGQVINLATIDVSGLAIWNGLPYPGAGEVPSWIGMEEPVHYWSKFSIWGSV